MRLNFLDAFLDKITMYQLLWWYLRILIAIAIILSFLGKIAYSPFAILVSALVFISVCWGVNKIFAWFFKAATNIESAYLTGLILTLIISPSLDLKDILFFVLASILAMASKYILAIGKKHIFNPAAIAVVITAFVFHQYASWWVGTAWMLPFVGIGGILLVKKIQRFDLFISFLITAFVCAFAFSFPNHISFSSLVSGFFLDSAIVFFASVMLTEPLTTPPNRKLRIWYGILTGLLYSPQVHLSPQNISVTSLLSGFFLDSTTIFFASIALTKLLTIAPISPLHIAYDLITNVLYSPQVHLSLIYSTPELTLVVANIFSYVVSPKIKLILYLKEKIQVGLTQVDFVFQTTRRFAFQPGQYMEWTLEHHKPDRRGNRRYFTIASSPTEDHMHLGVKFYENGSTYKKNLQQLTHTTPVVASQIAGDFILPKDIKRKLVFIAGGIGITPYRSMIKYLVDKQKKRDIVLLYSNKTKDEIMYKDVFEVAEKSLGIRTIYTLTDETVLPQDWKGEKGRISIDMLQKYLPDWRERYFYLSGPHVMVDAYEHILHEMGVQRAHIKKDFFPGFV